MKDFKVMSMRKPASKHTLSFFAILALFSICFLGYAASTLPDSDGNGVPDGYKIKSLKSKAVIARGKFNGQDCIEIESTGKNGFTRVYFPVAETVNKSKETEYYLFIFRVKLGAGAEAKGFVKTSEGVSSGSPQFKFMPWKDFEVSRWMNVRTPVELKPGDSIKKVYANISFTALDAKAWVGSQSLRKINAKKYKAVLDTKKWEIVSEKDISPEELKGVKKGNLLRNSSFELGSMGYSYPLNIYKRIKDDDGVDGKSCLSFAKGGYNAKVESLFYRLTPGKLYTFSTYLKADKAGTNVSLSVLSGYQAGPIRPRASMSVKVGTEWKRYHFSFIPEYASKSSCRIIVYGENFQMDAMQLEEGKLSEYKPDKTLDIGVHRDIASKDALYQLGEKAAFNIEIDCLDKNPGEITLKYIISDYWGNELISRKEKIDLSGKRKTRHKASFSTPESGVYKLRVECENPNNGEKVVSEQRSFGVLPNDIPSEVKEPSYFGMHVFKPNEVPIARKAGLGWARMWDSQICKFKWSRVEKEKGKVIFKDKELAKCYDAGFKILGTISHAPEWVLKNKKPGKGVLKDIPEFKRFVYDTVSRFKDKVKYWEVLNEPYFIYSSKEYAEVLKIAYPEIKRADPDAKVVGICGFMLPGYYMDWIEGILKEVGTDYMDIISTHAYIRVMPEFDKPTYSKRLELLRALLKKYGKKEIPIWDTESTSQAVSFYDDRLFGADTDLVRGTNGKEFPRYEDGCNWLVRHRIIGIANGVTKSFYYAMQTIGIFGHVFNNSWMLEYTRSPHPLLMANATLAKEVNGADYSGEISLGEKTRCYTFFKGETPLCVLWRVSDDDDLTEDSVILKGDVSKLEFTNIMGGKYQRIVKKDAVQIEFKISGEPVYIKAPGTAQEQFKKLLENAKIISSEKLKAAAFGVRLSDDSGKMFVKVRNLSSDPQDAFITISSKPKSWEIQGKNTLKAIKPETTGNIGIPILKMTGKGEIKAIVNDSLGKSPCEVTAYPRKCIVATPVSGKISLDGAFKDWPKAKEVKISERSQVKAGIDEWNGEKDLSTSVSACYDSENIYFAIRVKDEKILVEGTGASARKLHKLYRSDCVELFFEPDIMNSIKPDIYQFMFATSSKEQNLPVAKYLFNRSQAEGIEIVSIENSDGYDLELKVPFATFEGVKLEKGSMLGFDFTVNDKDKAKSKLKSVSVWSGTTGNHSDSSKYGILKLGE